METFLKYFFPLSRKQNINFHISLTVFEILQFKVRTPQATKWQKHLISLILNANNFAFAEVIFLFLVSFNS